MREVIVMKPNARRWRKRPCDTHLVKIAVHKKRISDANSGGEKEIKLS